jgi:ankyrin repeat protein
LDYIENRLGETEEDPTERDRHQQLKADSYPKKLRSLLRLLMQDAIFSGFSDVQLNKALLIAARFGFLQIVQLLCQCDRVNINTVNSGRDTPLILAAFNGHDACLQVLLPYPVLDWGRSNVRGNTALICAAISGHADCIVTLMKAFVANPDRYADMKCRGEGDKTALAWAVELGHVDCVLALLENGYRFGFCDARKLLTLAIKQGDVESLKRLSSIIDDAPTFRRAEVLSLSASYTNALRDAVSLQQLECVKWLLTNRYTAVNGLSYRSPPLSIAVKNNDVACVKILLQHPDMRVGAVGSRDLLSSPIAEGVKHGAVDCLQLMFKHASFFKDSVVLGSLLIWAVKGGYKAGVRFLLSDPGIDVNFKGVDGWTALLWAVKEPVDLEIIRDLLNHPDIDVNVKTLGGWSVLMHAVRLLHVESVRLLLAHKNIDMNVKNANGRTVQQLHARLTKKLHRYSNPDNPDIAVVRNLLSAARPSCCFSLRMFCCGGRALVGAPSLQAEPESKQSHGKS